MIVDVAVRRLVINQSDLESIREWLSNLVGNRRSTYEGTESEQRMSDLMRAKRRAVDGDDEGGIAPASSGGQC